MRNARNCGCSFNQDQNTSCYTGERIRVNQGCSRCDHENETHDSRGGCQETYRPRPCPPKPCPPRPCPPKPCPPRPCPPKPCPPRPCPPRPCPPKPYPPRPCPVYDEYENNQPCNGRHDNPWEEGCDCKGKRPQPREYYEEEYFEEDED